MADPVLLNHDQSGVATLTLNRPEIHNAFDDTLIAALISMLESLDRSAAVRAVVLTGSGKSFSAGADVAWMRSMAGYSETENYADAKRLADLLQTLNDLSKPTIARVNGSAFGGGVGLICCCDIAIAANDSTFALTEVRLGLVPAVISPYVIAAIGARQARRYFQTAESMDTATARDLGLIHVACPATDLDTRVDEITSLLARGGPTALAECKSLIAEVALGAADPESLRDYTARRIAHLRTTEEGQEGLAAFLDKRRPRW